MIRVYYIMYFIYTELLNDKLFNFDNIFNYLFEQIILLIINSISKYMLSYSNNCLCSIIY